MAVRNDPDQLFQGTDSGAISDLTFASASGNAVTLTGGATLPTVTDDEYIEVRGAALTENNGLYRVNDGSPTSSAIICAKITGADPTTDGTNNAVSSILGDSTIEKNIFYDTKALRIYIIEQNGLDVDGVEMNTLYSFTKEEWKDDDFLKAFQFPMFAIDLDAGKYVVGTDGSNANGWAMAVDNVIDGTIRTKKLIRQGGWSEVDSSNNLLRVYAGIITLGLFEDDTTDLAYYQFGTNTTVADEIDFDFAGPVDEAIECFTRLDDGAINGVTGIAASADGRVLTRSDGGAWDTDGFFIGGEVLFRNAEDSLNDSTFLIKDMVVGVDGSITLGRAADSSSGLVVTNTDTVTRADGGSWITDGFYLGGTFFIDNAEDGGNDGLHVITSISALALVATGSTLTNNTDDTVATVSPFDPTNSPDILIDAAVDNRKAFNIKLRVRDGDPTGKTFDFSNLTLAGVTTLNNFIFRFPVANASDLKITAVDTDIDSNSDGTPDTAPYTNMTITYFSTPQAQTGLVGGSFNYGITINADGGTAQETYEFVQWSLRSTGGDGTGDIDDDADTAIGRTMGDLLVFEGDILVAGDQQSVNPDGGGAGVFIENIAAADQNNVRLVDNLGDRKQFPETISVTLDFNQALIDDTVAEYTLWFDRTIRTAVTDLVITAGSGPVGTFDSAATELPAAMDNDPNGYVRITGLTGADIAMNGVYQVTATTSTAQWAVQRQDNATIVTTAGTDNPVNVDEHPIDSPDAIIVNSDSPAPVTGVASSDFNFAYDFDNNVQGGQAGGETAFVVGRAIGLATAQFVQSTVQSIVSGTPLTIVLTASGELNYIND